MSIAASTRLGPYEILGPLGAGGMGEVYRARDTRLGREVAVKVLPDGMSRDPEALARFEQEARAVAALSHPNIVALYDVGADHAVAYVVTELLQGETLRERLAAGGPLAPRKALEYAIEIAEGLGAAHERGFVHRDVKPENLFITRDGHVKILDFGVAVRDGSPGSEESVTGVNPSGLIMGTVGYVSPEQVTGHPATARSDLFAFGIVVHEMLTGAHPFKRGTPVETLTAILREDPPALARSVPGLAPAVARMVGRCLEKQPGDRPGSARDLAFYLEALGADAEAPPAAGVSAGVLRLGKRILTIWCGVLFLLWAATWGYVRVMTGRAVTGVIEADLARAEKIVTRVHDDRLTRLRLTARLVSSFPELKALLATDAATVRDFLLAYQQRNPGTPLLVALGPTAHVLASTDDSYTAQATGSDEWLAALVATKGEPAVVMVEGRPYDAAGAAAEAGGNVFGYVVAAAPADETFAQDVREATQDEVVLLSKDGVLASTLRAAQTPWRSLDAWHAGGGRADRSSGVRIGSQRFSAREVLLAADPPLSAVIVKSRDEAIEPYRRIQSGLVVIGGLAALAAIAATWWIRQSSKAVPR